MRSRSRHALVAIGLLVFVPATLRPQPPADVPVNDPAALLAPTDMRALVDSIAAMQHRLDSTRSRLELLSARDTALARQERTGLQRLEALEERISAVEDYLNQLRLQVAARSREIAGVTAAVCSTTAEVLSRRGLLACRLVGIYKYSRVFPVQAFFSTRSLPELYRRVLNLRWVSRADRQFIDGLAALTVRLEEQRVQLLAARVDLERLAAETRRNADTLARARAEADELVKRIRLEQNANRALQAELTAASTGLESLVDMLHRRKAASTTPASAGLASLRGKLPWPLLGRVISGFGSQTHPKYRTKTTNLGMDIRPKAAASAAAVADGRVVYADRFLGYGVLVILDHSSGYYTLYGNLSEPSVTVGTHLDAGTAVGRVDDYLHFEIRRQGQPLDPLPWLLPK